MKPLSITKASQLQPQGTPEIPDPTNYINTTNSNDAVWVRTISSSNCYQISKINIEIRNTRNSCIF